MPNTISGFAGVAFATVVLSGSANGSTTADSQGSYSFTGLANGNYTITPSSPSYTFGPTSLNETISGANITNVNFNATMAIGAPPVLTQTVQDTFQRANENPLNPSNWTKTQGALFTPLQIVSNLCKATAATGECAEEWTGTVLPSNQFGSLTLNQLSVTGELHIACRQVSTSGGGVIAGYDVAIIGPLGLLTPNIVLFDQATAGNNVLGTAAANLALGDVITVCAAGSTIYVLRNGVVVIQVNGNTSTPSGGRVEINCTAFSNVSTDASLSLFAAGSALAPFVGAPMPAVYPVF